MNNPMIIPVSSKVDRPMSSLTRHRFYQNVSVSEMAGGFGILLDGKTVRTPSGALLVAPTRRLADAVAGEWAAQGERVRPEKMGQTALLNTALDRVLPQRARVVDALIGYGATDLLCYRAGLEEEELAIRQANLWQPVLDRLDREDGIRLEVTIGITPIAQPAESMTRLRNVLESANEWELTAIQALAAALGSVVLSISIWRGWLSAEDAFLTAHIDEDYQEQRWGTDSEAIARRDVLRTDVLSAGTFLDLLKCSRPE